VTRELCNIFYELYNKEGKLSPSFNHRTMNLIQNLNAFRYE